MLTVQQLKEEYNAGASLLTLERRHAIPHGTIRGWLRKEGFIFRPPNCDKLSENDIQTALQHLRNGIKPKEVAKLFNVSRQAISKLAAKHGLKLKSTYT